VAEVLVASVTSTKISTSTQSLSAFDATRLPAVSVGDYMRRLERYLSCSEQCFVVSLVLMERVFERNSAFAITDFNVHRFLLVATITAAKFQDDDFYSNAYYSKVGGVCPDELLTLEVSFLEMIGWRCHVTVADYENCLQRLRDSKVHLGQVDTGVAAVVAPNVQEPEPMACEDITKPQTPQAVPGPVLPEAHNVMGYVAGTDATPMQQNADMTADVARKAAALVIGDHGTQCSAWNSQRRPRRRSTTPVTHLNARRTRLCLVVH